jgi:hypothetical protein
VEKLAQWAFDERLQEREKQALAKAQPTNPTTGNAKGKGGGKGKGPDNTNTPPPPPQQDATQLAELRKARMEQLKAAAAPPAPKPNGADTIAPAVAKAFDSPPKDYDTGEEMHPAPAATVELCPDLCAEVEAMAAQAKAVTDSLREERFPKPIKPLSPEEALENLLAASDPLSADSERGKAEQALAATKSAITTLTQAGTAENDQAITLLKAKQNTQPWSLREPNSKRVGRRKRTMWRA